MPTDTNWRQPRIDASEVMEDRVRDQQEEKPDKKIFNLLP